MNTKVVTKMCSTHWVPFSATKLQVLKGKKIASLTRKLTEAQKKGPVEICISSIEKWWDFSFTSFVFVGYWRDYLAAYGSDPSDR